MQVSVQKWGTKRVTTIFRNVKIVCTLILNPNGDYISGQSGKCQSGLPDGSHIHRTDARSNSWNGSQIGEMARSRFSRSCCTFAVVRCCAKAVFWYRCYYAWQARAQELCHRCPSRQTASRPRKSYSIWYVSRKSQPQKTYMADRGMRSQLSDVWAM